MMKVTQIFCMSVVVCLAFTACGSDTNKSTASLLAQELGYGYLAEFSTLQLELDDMAEAKVLQEAIFIRGYNWGREDDDELLYIGDLTTNLCSQIDWKQEAGESIAAMAENVDGAGCWLVIENVSSDYIPSYTARFYNTKGNLTKNLELTDALRKISDFRPTYAVEADNGLVLASDSDIICVDFAGSVRYTIALDENSRVTSMARTGDGRIFLSQYISGDNGKYTVAEVNGGKVAELELSEVVSTGRIMLFSGIEDNVLISDGAYLYTFHSQTGELTKLLSWLDSDIDSGTIVALGGTGENTITALLYNVVASGDTKYEMGKLVQTPVEELPERKILTLGATELPDVIQNAIVEFNRKNNDYRVALVDYSRYNTEEDNTLGQTQLERDVISGSAPDLILLDSRNKANYIEKGVLADMTSLLEADKEITLGDLVAAPLQAYTAGEKLYGMPCFFDMSTMLASRQLVGEKEGWTIEEMADVINGLTEDVAIMQYESREFFLKNMVAINMDQFVNFTASSCCFDIGAFASLLEAAERLPTQDERNQETESREDAYLMLQSGRLLMISEYVYDAYSIKLLFNLYTKKNGFTRIGYPTESGNGAKLSVGTGVGIYAQSDDISGAWEFIKTLLSNEIQKNVTGFPVTVKAFDAMLNEGMTEADGGETAYIGDKAYALKALTMKQAETFREYVNNAEIGGADNTDILRIVAEEAEAYFAGDKTAEEVAELIQNRVTIYLGETR